MISYAQNYEDVLLNRVFAERSNGFYIDVGACHPVVHSVTKLFYDRGWRGINIEPTPSAASLLARERAGDINLQVGLSDQVGTLTFYECPPLVELSTFCPDQADELRRQGFELVEHSVPITTLARVCEEHAGATIDFLKIDVESFERNVISGGDWTRFRPRVVVVEATRPDSSIPSFAEWEPLLLSADYIFAFFDGLNRYYTRSEDRQLIPLLAVPANYFDRFEHFEHHEHIRQLEELRHDLAERKISHEKAQDALETAQSKLEDTRTALTEMQRIVNESQLTIDELRTQLGATEAQLAPFLELGPIAIRVARRLRRMSHESPRIAALVKRMIRRAYPRVRELVPDV